MNKIKSLFFLSDKKKVQEPVSANTHTAPTGEKEKYSSPEGEVQAAISAALYELNENVHDAENPVLTIHQGRQDYSPWRSKAHMLRQMPHR